MNFKRIVILFLIFFLSNRAHAQQSFVQSLRLKTGAPIPVSQTSFRTFWCPSVDLDLTALKSVHSKLYAGLDLNFSLFHCRWIHQLKSSINVVNPNITIAYEVFRFKRFYVLPEFSAGYSWMIFTNPETPKAYLKKYNESGLSIRPGIDLGISFKKRFCLGLCGSCKTIFTRFGNSNIDLYNGYEEAEYISYINAGIYFQKKF